MLKVLFFASVREQLDCAELELPWTPDLASPDDLRRTLSVRGERWQQVLQQDNLVCALNHDVVAMDASVSDGDEVAFYPPVTGG